ncbi:MAG: peptidylprolyl isomerase [Alphaproteobacteria bacterium]
MMKKTKTILKKAKQKPVSKAVVLQPIRLPVVTELPKHKVAWGRFVLSLFLFVLDLLVWTYVFFRLFEIYNNYHMNRPVHITLPQQHKENVVARIGNEEISLDDVKSFVAEVPQLAEVPFEQVYPNILNMMINDKVIENGAKRHGISNDPKIKKMIQMASDQIVAQAYLAKEMEKALTESDIRAVYDEEVKNFKPDEEIHARHILVLTEKQAQDILIQLKAGADFGLLADQKSIDKNAEKGDLGYFTKEMMIPEFAEAVFAMKKGELSGPIKTAYGWHIVLVEDRRPTQPPAFDQVREQMSRIAVERKVPEILAQERERQQVRILRPTLTSSPAPQAVPDSVPVSPKTAAPASE